MASSSRRKYGSSGHSSPRKRVVIGAEETVRVRYHRNEPQVEAERKSASRRRTSGTPDAKRAPRSPQGRRLSSAKREERERRQRAMRIRRVLFSAATLGVLGLIVWGVVALTGAPFLAVTSVKVEGVRHLDAATVRDLAAVPDDATMLRLAKRGIERRVAASAWVSEVEVDRDFPHTLIIRVVERTPVAVVDAGGSDLWVVSKDEYWLGRMSAEESSVPVIQDVEGLTPKVGARVATPELKNAVALASGLGSELLAITRAISAPSVEKTAVITRDDVEIYFGEAERVAMKARIAQEILEEQEGVVYINVRVVESPTWRGVGE